MILAYIIVSCLITYGIARFDTPHRETLPLALLIGFGHPIFIIAILTIIAVEAFESL
jgi:hypothetical protein